MPAGDPGGNMQGGYGGNFGGFGGSSMNSQPGGPAHGSLGFGGMSPGGYNSSVYNANALGMGGVPGFGKRVLAARALAQKLAFANKYPNFPTQGPQPKPGVNPTPGVIRPAVTTPPGEVVPEEPIDAPLDPIMGAPPPTGIGLINPGQWPNNAWRDPYPGYGFPHMQNQMDKGGWDTSNVDHEIGIGGLGPKDQSRLGNRTGYGRQFGGPVAPGQTYTVGENGPETLQMGATGGQVTPMNPADRLGGMPQNTLRDMFQLQMGQMGNPTGMQQPSKAGYTPPAAPAGPPGLRNGGLNDAGPLQSHLDYMNGAPQAPPGSHSTSFPPMGGVQPPQPQMPQPYRRPDSFGGGGFRNAGMGTRTAAPQRQYGFGGSAMGMPGLMGRLRSQLG